MDSQPTICSKYTLHIPTDHHYMGLREGRISLYRTNQLHKHLTFVSWRVQSCYTYASAEREICSITLERNEKKKERKENMANPCLSSTIAAGTMFEVHLIVTDREHLITQDITFYTAKHEDMSQDYILLGTKYIFFFNFVSYLSLASNQRNWISFISFGFIYIFL